MVCTDISEEMIRLTKHKIDNDADYHSIASNSADIEIADLPESFDLEGYLRERRFKEREDRMVVGRLANNERLPFVEGTFDCYISCLSLMLVDSQENMLREALRVTVKGAHFAFSVWGRKENI